MSYSVKREAVVRTGPATRAIEQSIPKARHAHFYNNAAAGTPIPDSPLHAPASWPQTAPVVSASLTRLMAHNSNPSIVILPLEYAGYDKT